MTEIKRYEVDADPQDGPASLWDVEDENGKYVYYEDHAAIVSAKNARIAELERSEKLHSQRTASFDILNRKYINLKEQVRAMAAENSKLRDWLISDTMCEVDETAFPATDAAIREILAQGVEEFASWQRELAINSQAEVRYAYLGSVKDAQSYAARIRAGEIL